MTASKKTHLSPALPPAELGLTPFLPLPRALPAQHCWAFQENDSFPIQINNKRQRQPRCLPHTQRAAQAGGGSAPTPARSTRPWGRQEHGDTLKPRSPAGLQSCGSLACSRHFLLVFVLDAPAFLLPGRGVWRREGRGEAAIGDGCTQIPRVALSLLLREQKQTLGEKKKYNAASLTEQSSHDIRNHKAEAHARKERGERGISWTLVPDSGLNN